MKLEQLEQLVLIEKYGSISKAAKEIYMTPSTLSNNLSNLESEIGVRLFERSPLGVTPTKEGMEVVCHARSILSECEQILNYGKREEGLTGEVTVLIAPGYQFLYTDIITAFQKQYPEADLHLRIFTPGKIFDSLQQGIAHVGIVSMSENNMQHNKKILEGVFEVEQFQNRNAEILVACNHKLAEKDVISIRDIKEERLIIFSEENWDAIGMNLEKELKNNNRYMAIEDMETTKQLICDGEGVCILPERFIDFDWRIQQGRIKSIPINDFNNVFSDCLLYPSKRKLTLLEKRTIELLKSVLAELKK